MREYMPICLLPLTLHNKQRAYLCTHNKFYFEEEFDEQKKKKRPGGPPHTTNRPTDQPVYNNSAQCGAHGP